jgi:streptomycin 6-kinase
LTAESLDADALAEFGVSEPTLLARTTLATVWKVRHPDSDVAVLKIYHGKDMANEAGGIDFLNVLGGQSCVKIFQTSSNAVLMEWLSGPSLATLCHTGADKQACDHLISMARALHLKPIAPTAKMQPLDQWCVALFKPSFTSMCPENGKRDLMKSAELAKFLLSSPRDLDSLHGDLHYDNVLNSPRGWCAIDAKGVFGERTFELANAFRNPKATPNLTRDPMRARRLADQSVQGFGVERTRLLQWAAVKCALSIVWRAKGRIAQDPEFKNLEMLLTLAEERSS